MNESCALRTDLVHFQTVWFSKNLQVRLAGLMGTTLRYAETLREFEVLIPGAVAACATGGWLACDAHACGPPFARRGATRRGPSCGPLSPPRDGGWRGLGCERWNAFGAREPNATPIAGFHVSKLR
jgi:hypothetical protein